MNNNLLEVIGELVERQDEAQLNADAYNPDQEPYKAWMEDVEKYREMVRKLVEVRDSLPEDTEPVVAERPTKCPTCRNTAFRRNEDFNWWDCIECNWHTETDKVLSEPDSPGPYPTIPEEDMTLEQREKWQELKKKYQVERDETQALLEEACTEIIRQRECIEATQAEADQFRVIEQGMMIDIEEVQKTMREIKDLHEEYRTQRTEGLKAAISKLANL